MSDYVYVSPAEKSGQPKLPMHEVYSILKQKMKSVEDFKPDAILDSCKYIRLARRHHYKNYRLLFYKDIKPWGLMGSFSYYQANFFSKSGCTLGIFNELNGNLISIIWRATNDKEFMNYSLQYTLYGYDMISPDFKYGDWLVLVEGPYDADVLRQVYPNVVATLTSSVTVNMAEILKVLTDKFIVAYDSDNAGNTGYEKAVKRLGNEQGDNIKKLPVFPGDKDIGVMEEKLDKSPQEFQVRYNFYKQTIDELINDTSGMIYL